MHAGADTAPPPSSTTPPTLEAGAGEARAGALLRATRWTRLGLHLLQGMLTIAAVYPLTGRDTHQALRRRWSLGLLRDAAIRQAQEKGLLAKPAEQPALPPPTPEEEQVMALNRERISEGLRELAQAMHTGVTPEWMKENIAKHKAVVMAELQHEEKGDGLDNTTVQALPSGAGHG